MLVACRLAGLSALEGHYADDNAQAQSGGEEQQERRRPRLSEGHARPGESCCDISPRGFVKVDLRPSVKAFAFPGRLTAGV
jgi:hypothetical protein